MKKKDFSNTGTEGGARLGDLTGRDYQKQDPPSPSRPARGNGRPAEIWLSKKGRAGKAVSLIKIAGLSERDKQEILKTLKAAFACGGSVKERDILLQMHQREKLAAFLIKRGFAAKICGG